MTNLCPKLSKISICIDLAGVQSTYSASCPPWDSHGPNLHLSRRFGAPQGRQPPTFQMRTPEAVLTILTDCGAGGNGRTSVVRRQVCPCARATDSDPAQKEGVHCRMLVARATRTSARGTAHAARGSIGDSPRHSPVVRRQPGRASWAVEAGRGSARGPTGVAVSQLPKDTRACVLTPPPLAGAARGLSCCLRRDEDEATRSYGRQRSAPPPPTQSARPCPTRAIVLPKFPPTGVVLEPMTSHVRTHCHAVTGGAWRCRGRLIRPPSACELAPRHQPQVNVLIASSVLLQPFSASLSPALLRNRPHLDAGPRNLPSLQLGPQTSLKHLLRADPCVLTACC